MVELAVMYEVRRYVFVGKQHGNSAINIFRSINIDSKVSNYTLYDGRRESVRKLYIRILQLIRESREVAEQKEVQVDTLSVSWLDPLPCST